MAKMKRGDGLTLGYNEETELKKIIRVIFKRKKSIRGKRCYQKFGSEFLGACPYMEEGSILKVVMFCAKSYSDQRKFERDTGNEALLV